MPEARPGDLLSIALTVITAPPMTFRMFKLLTQLNPKNTSKLCWLLDGWCCCALPGNLICEKLEIRKNVDKMRYKRV